MQVSAVTYNPLLTDFVSSTSNTYPLNLALVHNAVWSQTNGALPPAAPATATTGDNSSRNVLWWPEHSHRSILGILAAPTATTTNNNNTNNNDNNNTYNNNNNNNNNNNSSSGVNKRAELFFTNSYSPSSPPSSSPSSAPLSPVLEFCHQLPYYKLRKGEEFKSIMSPNPTKSTLTPPNPYSNINAYYSNLNQPGSIPQPHPNLPYPTLSSPHNFLMFPHPLLLPPYPQNSWINTTGHVMTNRPHSL